LFLAAVPFGCDRTDGNRLANVGRKVAEKVQVLVPERTPFGAPITTSSNVEDRVKERFRSDRFLSPIQFEFAVDGSTIRLKGIVDDEVLKKRAVEIAGSTVGVDKVIDELTVK
jgi:osmotically-inducible protein OsmY